MMKIQSLFRSRRFWATVATSIFMPIAPAIGMDQNTATVIAGVVASWIIGDSLKNTE